ncbi:hypothetical protein QYE76_048141 [Lolium multiflorum]|uniref:DUF4218 domain-containing protein n=1 Tax=Lolium multiflorum TaxID=4521 RepID=A0AAD8V0R3_LOLMU|nr:hypothetical protein QYE76_048141 [Lolium multiflorum]
MVHMKTMSRDDYHHEEDYHHADGDYHHEEEVGGEDHHEEEDVGGEHHHDEEEDSGATPLISALLDSHVQDLLLQETSNDRVAARERAKLSQMEKDGMTPIFPGKVKDGPKARYDLKHFGIGKDLQAPRDDDDDDDDRTEGTQRLQRAKKNAVLLPCLLQWEELEQFSVPPRSESSSRLLGNISRYLDVAKKRFTGMKSHDCHVLMTQILPVAIRGIMDEHVRDTLFGLCNFFDVITRKSIGVRQLKMLQDEILVILCELEIYFPPAFCDICIHLLLHVVEDKQLGPTFLHNMMPFKRQNGVMKGYVRNRARPDASMAKGFLTYECISFCQNYLSTEDDEDHVGLPPEAPREARWSRFFPDNPSATALATTTAKRRHLAPLRREEEDRHATAEQDAPSHHRRSRRRTQRAAAAERGGAGGGGHATTEQGPSPSRPVEEDAQPVAAARRRTTPSPPRPTTAAVR